MPDQRRQKRRRLGSRFWTRRPGSNSPASSMPRAETGGLVQETSLLELFETALGRPRQSEGHLAERAPPELDLDFAFCPIEVAEPEPLDPVPPEAGADILPPNRARAVTPGLLISMGRHVMPPAGLIAWSSAQPEIAAPIPVQLVIEQPPPPPPPEEKPPAQGPLASAHRGQ